MSERPVIFACGGPPLSVSAVATVHDLSVGVRDAPITLRIEDLHKKMVAHPPDELLDLLDVAAYIYTADQMIRRNNSLASKAAWQRELTFHIHVRQPDRWSAKPVREALARALHFVSDDHYDFQFDQLTDRPQDDGYFEWGDDEAEEKFERVLLFSGGLDSLGGAVEEWLVAKRRTAIVSHRSIAKIDSRQRKLVAKLRQKAPHQLLHVPVWLNKESRLTKDYTQRTRSFLYLTLGAVVARMLGVPDLHVYENGVTTVNPPIVEQVLGTRATRSTHPKTMRLVEEFLQALLEDDFSIRNPFLFKTKTDVVRQIRDAGAGDLIAHSVSCAHTMAGSKEKPHCGTCTQCIDRRFATLAAGCTEAEDPADGYRVPLLTGALQKTEHRTAVESYYNTARQWGEDDGVRFDLPEMSRVVNCVPGMRAREVAEELHRVFQSHGRCVLGVVDEGISDHASEIRNRALPSTCLIAMVIDGGYQRSETTEPSESCFVRKGDSWWISYKGEDTMIRHMRGLSYIRVLLENPTREFSPDELVTEAEGGSSLSEAGIESIDRASVKELEKALDLLKEKISVTSDQEERVELEDQQSFILSHLGKTTGLGGRPRRRGVPTRRRDAVRKAIERAIAKIRGHIPAAAAHFDDRIKRGGTVVYTDGTTGEWVVRP